MASAKERQRRGLPRTVTETIDVTFPRSFESQTHSNRVSPELFDSSTERYSVRRLSEATATREGVSATIAEGTEGTKPCEYSENILSLSLHGQVVQDDKRLGKEYISLLD